MKIELVEETQFNKEPWYCVQVNDVYIIGTGIKKNAEELYDRIVKDPSLVEKKKNILKSEEIDVNL